MNSALERRLAVNCKASLLPLPTADHEGVTDEKFTLHPPRFPVNGIVLLLLTIMLWDKGDKYILDPG